MREYEKLYGVDSNTPTQIEHDNATEKILEVAGLLTEYFEYSERRERQTSVDFNLCKRGFRHGEINPIPLADGVAVIYTTEGFLEYRSHRFIFPQEGEVAYHREPYGIDCQSIGSRSLKLSGVEAITSDRNTVRQVDFLHSEITQIALRGWDTLIECRVKTATC